jgi:hypothetical protein
MGGKRRLVDGFKWVCTEGRDQCEACSALCGREFLHDPEPGQPSVEGMPEPPLHPHCSCRLELLSNAGAMLLEMSRNRRLVDDSGGGKPADLHGLDPQLEEKLEFTTPGLSEYFNTGHYGWLDMVYGCDGRSIIDGPSYGNYGGERWRFGRNESKIDELVAAQDLTRDEWLAENYIPTVDSLDRVFEDHDYCYDKGGNQPNFSAATLACDQAMIKTLEGLDEDPRKWPNPPQKEEDVEYARKFRETRFIISSPKLIMG